MLSPPAPPPKAERRILLTGATGFLGAALLAEILVSTEAEVTCLVRAEDAPAARDRVLGALSPWLGADSARALLNRIRALPGDVAAPGLGLDSRTWHVLAEWSTGIIHCAATVRFDEPLSVAQAINVGGVQQMLELARAGRDAGSLVRAVMVSTAYVAGSHTGWFAESDLDVGQTFRNTYEHSKFTAEQAVRRAADQLPLCVVRPSIIVGHSQSGRTTAFNVLYPPVRLLLRHAGSATLPVRADILVDTVPVDWVARAILAALTSGRDGETYASASGARALTAADVAAVASDVFGFDRVSLLPAETPQEVAVKSTRAWRRSLSVRERQAIAQYAPYIAPTARFDSSRGDALMRRAGHHATDPRHVLTRCLEYARATRFGRIRRDVDHRRCRAIEQSPALA